MGEPPVLRVLSPCRDSGTEPEHYALSRALITLVGATHAAAIQAGARDLTRWDLDGAQDSGFAR